MDNDGSTAGIKRGAIEKCEGIRQKRRRAHGKLKDKNKTQSEDIEGITVGLMTCVDQTHMARKGRHGRDTVTATHEITTTIDKDKTRKAGT